MARKRDKRNEGRQEVLTDVEIARDAGNVYTDPVTNEVIPQESLNTESTGVVKVNNESHSASNYTPVSESSYGNSDGYDSSGYREGRDPYGNGQVKSDVLAGQSVVAVRKNENGAITAFKLADGTVMQYEQAVEYLKQNPSGFDNLILQQGNQGDLIIRSKPDGDPTNNLDNLPTF